MEPVPSSVTSCDVQKLAHWKEGMKPVDESTAIESSLPRDDMGRVKALTNGMESRSDVHGGVTALNNLEPFKPCTAVDISHL